MELWKHEHTFSTYLGTSWWPFIISFFASVIAGIRVYMGGTKCPSNNRINGKVVLITGGSAGLGLETAKELAARGAQIILTCRNAIKGKKALDEIRYHCPDAKVVVKMLDVSLLWSISDFVKEIEAEFDKVDILINNAGIMFHPFQKTSEGNELTAATNYLGPFTLTHLLLPLLNKSDNGRVINIAALAHYIGKIDLEDLNNVKHFTVEDAYASSKLCLILFTKHMASLYKKTNITFNSVSPGLVRGTAHLKNSILQNSLFTRILLWPFMWLLMKTPKQGCQTIVYAAVEPSLNNVSGAYLSDCEIKEPAKSALDTLLREELYRRTCELCKINGEGLLEGLVEDNQETEYIHVENK